MVLSRRKPPTDRKKLGQWGEKECEKYLSQKNYRILARNFSCKTGEIDLIMVDHGGTVVFIEVKTRTNDDFQPVEYVMTNWKKNKLQAAARYFLTINKIEKRPYRFDFVAVILKNKSKKLKHYKNVFTPYGQWS